MVVMSIVRRGFKKRFEGELLFVDDLF